jgi:putrescine transport system ATP-binding protein
MQAAPPAEIYEQPASRWVADFIGSVNLIEGRVGPDGSSVEGTAFGRLRVAAKIAAAPGTTVWVAVRPEKLRMAPNPAAPDQQSALENDVAATLVDVAYLGDLSIYRLRTDAGVPLQASSANTAPLTERAVAWNDKLWLNFPRNAAIVLTQ